MNSNRLTCAGCALPLLVVAFVLTVNAQQIVVYPAPQGAPVTTSFAVRVSSLDVPVYIGTAPGGATYYFCSFDFDGTPVSVEVTGSGISITNPQVRPASSGIGSSVSGTKATFRISKKGQYAFIPDGSGYANALFVFANPLEVNPPSNGDPNVIYFGPGVHVVNNLNINSNQTLYVHGSAFLKGGLNLSGKSNIKIRGRGIIDGTDWGKWAGPTGYNYALIHLENTSNVSIEGIIVRASWAASIHVWSSTQTTIDNVKVCNSRFGNDDGIAPINTRTMTIRNSFVRTDDDCVPMKGYNTDRADNDSITVENCVFWCDRARIVLIGSENMVQHMKNINIRNCEVIHYEMPIFNAQATEEGTIGPNVVMENINVQSDNVPPSDFKEFIRIVSAVESWAQLATPGFVDGVTVRNITLTGPHNGGQLVLVAGYDARHTVKNVNIECVKINGKPLTSATNGVSIGGFTSGINFTACTPVSTPIAPAGADRVSVGGPSVLLSPATSTLTMTNVPAHARISVFAMDGRMVAKVNPVGATAVVNVHAWDRATYLFRISSPTGLTVRKVALE